MTSGWGLPVTAVHTTGKTMQEIIAILEKLENGESKKFSELREAIATYLLHRGLDTKIAVDIRTKDGKSKLIDFAHQLINEYENHSEDVEQQIDKTFDAVDKGISEFQDQLLKTCIGRKGGLGIWAEIYGLNPQIITPEGLTQFTVMVDLLIDGKQPKASDPIIPTWEQVGGLLGADNPMTLRRICLDPDEFVTPAMMEHKKVTPDDDPAVAFLKQTIPQPDMIRMGIKMEMQQEIERFQRTLNVSGLNRREFTCRGLNIEYLSESWRLLLMRRDERKLKRQVNPVVDLFIQLAKMEAPKYKLSKVDYTDDSFGDRGEDIPTTYAQIREVASQAVSVLIVHESVEWESKPQKIISTKHGETEATIGHHVDKPDEPDDIILYLTMGWDNFERGNESEITTFRLTHPHRR